MCLLMFCLHAMNIMNRLSISQLLIRVLIRNTITSTHVNHLKTSSCICKSEKPFRLTTEHSVKNRPLISAWDGITERELARLMHRSTNDVEEAMILHDIDNLTDWKDVVRVCKALGFRCNQVRAPDDPAVEPSLIIRTGLFSQGVILEQDGGETQVVKMSALEGIGIRELKESVIALAETLDLKSPIDGDVIANVIESSLDPSKGRIATLLVRSGTLKKGDIIVSSSDHTICWAKVRAMFNEFGHMVTSVTPGFPVQVTGWKDHTVPDAGDQMMSVVSEKRAKEYIHAKTQAKLMQQSIHDAEEGMKKYEYLRKEYETHLKSKRNSEEVRSRYHRHSVPIEYTKINIDMSEEEKRRVNIVLKCDVNGSLEVLEGVLTSYPNDHEIVKIDVIHTGIGPVSESDMELASVFPNTIIYTFNVETPDHIDREARSNGIIIKQHNVIYHLINDVKQEINDRLPELDHEVIIGEALVLQEFIINSGNKKTQVAGVKCIKGSLKKGDKYFYKVVKSNDQTGNQTVIDLKDLLLSMRHVKEEVQEVRKESECGLRFDLKTVKSSYPDFKFVPGDKIICYSISKIKQKTKWTPEGF